MRTLAAAAYQPECAADGLHPVPEAYQARAAVGIGSADAVVADVEAQHATGLVDLDMNFGRVRMLGCIRQCLRYDIICRDLDMFRKPFLYSHIELYADR